MAKKKQEQQVEEKNVESTVKDDKIRIKKPSFKKNTDEVRKVDLREFNKKKKNKKQTMPFKSQKQRNYLWATNPQLAKQWEKKTPKAKLNKKIKNKFPRMSKKAFSRR